MGAEVEVAEVAPELVDLRFPELEPKEQVLLVEHREVQEAPLWAAEA